MNFPNQPTLEARQAALVELLLLLPDVAERMNALVAHAVWMEKVQPLVKVPADLVEGCVSQVWLARRDEQGGCVFRSAADSALVAGLVGAMTELASGLPPAELVAFQPAFLEAAGLWSQLSPTRQRGLSAVAQEIQAFARACS